MLSAPGARTVIDGVTYDYYGGTGYLGLQGRAEVIEAACRAAQTFGVHSATSRTRYASQPVCNVEALAGEFFGTEDAYYFVSGYLGNEIMVRALRDTVDAVFVDDASHYSGTEAAMLAGVPVRPFASRSVEDLQAQIATHLPPRGRPLVITDGVFPSFGQIAPVDRYLEMLAAYPGAAILVDDAHGFGVLGEHGRGSLEHLGLWDRANRSLALSDEVRLLVVGTLSKALGGFGGIIPGTSELVTAAIEACHVHEGASSPPAPTAAATARALQLVMSEPELRTTLAKRIRQVRDRLRGLGIDNDDLPTPIVGFTHRDAAAMRQLHERLLAKNIVLPYASSYSGVGPEGAMRLAVFATHEPAMLDRLFTALAESLH